MKTLLLLAAVTQNMDDCPATVKFKGSSPAVSRHANVYAQCLFQRPLGDLKDAAAAKDRCAAVRQTRLKLAQHLFLGKPGFRNYGARLAEARKPFDWLDHVAVTLTGCETDIRTGS